MAPATGTAVLVLVAFVLPGFVSLRYAEHTFLNRLQETPLERLLNALVYSVLTYLVLAIGAVALGTSSFDVGQLYRGEEQLGDYVTLASAAFFVAVGVAELGRRWRFSGRRATTLDRLGIDPAHRTPSGWEHFFLQGQPAFLRVTLRDKRVVGGFFGTASCAGSVCRATLGAER